MTNDHRPTDAPPNRWLPVDAERWAAIRSHCDKWSGDFSRTMDKIERGVRAAAQAGTAPAEGPRELLEEAHGLVVSARERGKEPHGWVKAANDWCARYWANEDRRAALAGGAPAGPTEFTKRADVLSLFWFLANAGRWCESAVVEGGTSWHLTTEENNEFDRLKEAAFAALQLGAPAAPAPELTQQQREELFESDLSEPHYDEHDDVFGSVPTPPGRAPAPEPTEKTYTETEVRAFMSKLPSTIAGLRAEVSGGAPPAARPAEPPPAEVEREYARQILLVIGWRFWQSEGVWLGVNAGLNLNALGDTPDECYDCALDASELLLRDLLRAAPPPSEAPRE